MKKESTRREFIAKSTMAGAGTLLGMKTVSLPLNTWITGYHKGSAAEKVISIKPRYHRWHVDPGVEWLETNTGYSFLDWQIPLSQTALVLVDVWQRHYIRDTEARAEKIINDDLLPLLASCRKAGMNIIHAPSPEVARLHQNWVNLQTPGEKKSTQGDWPPAEFINSSGPYKQFGMPFEPREKERSELPALTFHPKVVPLKGEPVVATGEELHRYCKKRGILFLLYAGFNTNACIVTRDYGTVRMRERGYKIILVRDCTTGMESKETQPALAQTNGAILFLEMFGSFTVASRDLISGLPA